MSNAGEPRHAMSPEIATPKNEGKPRWTVSLRLLPRRGGFGPVPLARQGRFATFICDDFLHHSVIESSRRCVGKFFLVGAWAKDQCDRPLFGDLSGDVDVTIMYMERHF